MKIESFSDIPDFDDEQSSFSDEGGYVPYQFLKEKDDDSVLRWLNEEFNYLYRQSKDRIYSYRRIARRCLNQDPRNNSMIRTSRRDMEESSDKPTIRTNFYLDYIDQKVAYASSTPIRPTFIPKVENSQEDINQAEACALLTKSRANQIGVEALMRDQDRQTFKYGTGITKIYWDDFAGPVDIEAVKKAKELGLTVDGAEVSEWNAKMGDVCAKVIPPYYLFGERGKKKWEDVNYTFEIEFCHIAEVRAEYPELDGIVKEDMFWLNMEDNINYNDENFLAKFYFYHKPTKYLPNGELIIFTYGRILERITDTKEIKKHMPDGELPYIFDEDIKDESVLWAFPFLINIEQSNNLYDLVQSGIARNVGVAQAPKLLVQEGSVNFKQLHNKYGVVQYSGAEPKWLQHNYVNKGEFEIQDRLERRMDKHAKVGAIARQDIPAGITATSALRLLDDKEMQANSEILAKKRERVKKFYWKLMKFQEANYRDDQHRMVATLGEDNTYLIESFLSPRFDIIETVEIENVSALSSTRAGRVSDIIDLNAANQKDPTFGRKEIIKLLNLGLEKAFVEETTYSVTTARTLLEYLKKGKAVVPPDRTDDLFEMYGIFSRYVESISYKMKISEEARTKINDYIEGIEFLIADQANRNPVFKAKMMEYPKYPMFYDAGSIVFMQGAEQVQAPQGNAGGTAKAGLPSMNEKNQKQLSNEMQ